MYWFSGIEKVHCQMYDYVKSIQIKLVKIYVYKICIIIEILLYSLNIKIYLSLNFWNDWKFVQPFKRL